VPLSHRQPAKRGKKGGHGGGGIGGFLGKAVHEAADQAGKIGRSAQEDITGFPSGAFKLSKDAALAGLGNPEPLSKDAFTLGKQTVGTVQHPVRAYNADPFGTILTALGIASGGAGMAARAGVAAKTLGETGQLGKALSAGKARPIYTKHIDLRKSPMETTRKSSSGRKLTTKHKYRTVEASRNPVFRGAGKAIDRTAGRTKTVQARRARKGEMLHNMGVKRLEVGNQPARRVQVGGIHPALAAPMDAMRLSMYLRPRTALQNAVQSGMMIAQDQGLGAIKSMRDLRKLKTPANKDILENIRASVGESAARSLTQSGVGRGKLGNLVSRLAEISNYPEAKIRPLSAMKAARDRGVVTPQQFRDMFENPHGNLYQRYVTAANEAVGDFGRLGPRERSFMKTQIPIFYPMFKALTRYGARFPGEHSIQSALLADAGHQGKAYQRAALGNLPWWASYMVPTSKGHALNPANIVNFQPGTDVATQTAEMIRGGGPRPGMSLLQEASPLPATLYTAFTGNDLGSGYPSRGMKLGMGSAPAALKDQWDQSLFGQILSAADRGGIPTGPGSKFAVNDTPTKSYKEPDFLNWLALQALGPSFVPRGIRVKELNKQYKRQQHYGKHSGKRGERPTSGNLSNFGSFTSGLGGGFGSP